MFNKRHPRYNFWVRAEQARLMLTRLNVGGFSSKTATGLLDKLPSSRLEACCFLYQAYAAISARTASLETRGLEIREYRVICLEAVERHFLDHLYPSLVGGEPNEMFSCMCKTAIEVAHNPEIVFAQL